MTGTQGEHPRTATVEVLTAEVRVLMVGSRQITLSVFRQLDIIDYESLEPMGRVNDRDTVWWIIGRNDNGILARAKFWNGETIPRMDRADVEEKGRLLSSRRHFPDYFTDKNTDRLSYLERLEEEINEARQVWREDKAEYDALPLIIMAGLR